MARSFRALFHPLRAQRWAFSDLNPALSWLEPVANAVKEHRQAASAENPLRNVESLVSELTSASLDLQRALRDAFSEATFFEIYGNLAAFYLPDQQGAEAKALPADPRELSFVKEAMAAMDKGGYPEALARVGFLMAHKDEPLPLSRLQLAHDLLANTTNFCPTCRRTRHDGSVASRRSSPATSRTRRSRRCPSSCATRTTASACSPCSIACSPTSACKESSRRPSRPQCLHAFAGAHILP